jgi:hypothetical protein
LALGFFCHSTPPKNRKKRLFCTSGVAKGDFSVDLNISWESGRFKKSPICLAKLSKLGSFQTKPTPRAGVSGQWIMLENPLFKRNFVHDSSAPIPVSIGYSLYENGVLIGSAYQTLPIKGLAALNGIGTAYPRRWTCPDAYP